MARSDHAWFTPIHWTEAEKILGYKVNRRRKYFTQSEEGKSVDNPYAFKDFSVFTYGEWTLPCSGCSCDCGDGYGCSHGAGGCSECGYTGKRRDGMHTPYNIEDRT